MLAIELFGRLGRLLHLSTILSDPGCHEEFCPWKGEVDRACDKGIPEMAETSRILYLVTEPAGSLKLQLLSNLAGRSHLKVRASTVLPDGELLPFGSILIIDVDSLGGPSCIVDRLLHLRSERGDIIVVLVSDEFSVTCVDETRLAIADASLKSPCSLGCFVDSLACAEANNRAWNARVHAVGNC